jgi:hypothetical protein
MDNQFGETNNYSQIGGGTSGSNVGRALNNYNLDAEYSRSILDVPNRLILAPVIELPFGRGRHWANQGGLAEALAGGWTVAGIFYFESGFPINVGQLGDNTGTFGGEQRPNINTSVDPNTSGDRETRFNGWINPAAYSLAPAFTFGNAPRTNPDLRTPDRNNIDLVISKDVSLSGQARAQVRLELLNLTNHVKTNGVEQRLGESNFGTITSQAGFMRIPRSRSGCQLHNGAPWLSASVSDIGHNPGTAKAVPYVQTFPDSSRRAPRRPCPRYKNVPGFQS